MQMECDRLVEPEPPRDDGGMMEFFQRFFGPDLANTPAHVLFPGPLSAPANKKLRPADGVEYLLSIPYNMYLDTAQLIIKASSRQLTIEDIKEAVRED